MAATPEAPITLGTTMRPAALLLALVVGELLDLTLVVVVNGFDVVRDGKPVDDPLEEVEGLPVVTVPLISAATVELNWPVIPVKLSPHVSCDQHGMKTCLEPT